MRLGTVLTFAFVVSLTGCGGSDEATSQAAGAARTPRWAQEYLVGRGPRGQLLMGTSDYAVGVNRIAFVLARENNEIVQVPRATVYAGPADASDPVLSDAELVPIGVTGETEAGHDHDDVPPTIYVANVRFSRPGRWWILVEPKGDPVRAIGVANVKPTSSSPGVGSHAYPSKNPTLAEAPVAKITTARPPDEALLHHSIADSIDAQKPFVVVFATPKFCLSRTCGPTVDVVEAVRKRYEASGVRFIHVEVYRNNDPQQGPNTWFQEWRLPTEPWVFLVDRSGVIRAKFEGSVSVPELEEAVHQHLLERRD